MSAEAKESVECLKRIQGEIEQIKKEESESIAEEINARLLQLKTQNPKEFSRLRTQLQDIFKEDS